MSRFLATLTAAVGLAAVVGAEGPPAQPSAVEQARQFRRNRPLIHTLVEGGLDLTARPQPLERADRCRRMAELLVEEIRQAVDDREPGRAAELAAHLQSVLERGVAANLATARGQIEVGSQAEVDLFARRDQATRAMRPLEEMLASAVARQPELRPLQDGLQTSKARIEQATKSRAVLDRRTKP